MTEARATVRTGWSSWLTRVSLGSLCGLAITGLVVTFAPFHPVVEWTVVVHTVVGIAVLIPITYYLLRHWLDYRRYRISDIVLLGYVALTALALCLVSGVVVTWQGALGVRMSPAWRAIHLYSTYATLAMTVAHGVLVPLRIYRPGALAKAGGLLTRAALVTAVLVAAGFGLGALYSGERYVNEFPDDYQFPYGEHRPFAPSLAVTDTGGAFAAESLANSASCGTAGCHTQILEEWQPSAHRYSAMDPLFQKVQSVMAEQNGAESTRYCGGCHDPISLFAGAKRMFTEDLTSQHGYQEGISCLSCHGVRETDLQGNADYTMTQPPAYLWQWAQSGPRKFMSDFLIRTYPRQHLELSKRLFKAPEYCAACHKQFIDQELNRVGWVQLQNQYDNWKASHWYVEGQPEKTIECRECHMPLVDSTDPASGDDVDYNRSPNDAKHRSHRFVAANTMVPAMLELPGWQEHVRLSEVWLRGDYQIPEIADKWRDGPVVLLKLETPESASPGQPLKVRVVMTANKVGHDFPTGPLDIIQSWVELHVYDQSGSEIFASGTRNAEHFIEPGSFLFKAEPVDQEGNLIDRHNLWEMVGVRYRRALFPGYSDSVEYLIDCPTTMVEGEQSELARTGKEEQSFVVPSSPGTSEYRVVAQLNYRKVDQFLINFLLGADSGLTAPVIEMNRAEATVPVNVGG